MDPKQLRQIIRKEITTVVQTELKPVKKDLNELRGGVSTLKKDLKEVKKEVLELKENVDAARGDIEKLHLDVKGIRDKEGLFHSRNKREIDEIKTHLGLPLMSDTL